MSSTGLLFLAPSSLNLDAILLNGQSFRWIREGSQWLGVAKGRLWRLCRCSSHPWVEWSVIARSPYAKREEDERVLHQYLQTSVSLESLYALWAKADPHMKNLLCSRPELYGIRVLAQDPLETTLAFICSANNNIKRISQMVNRLAEFYGERLCVEEGVVTMNSLPSQLLFDFPQLDNLHAHVSSMEREAFGYRAGYIANTVRKLKDELDSVRFFEELRLVDYDTAKERLQQLPGVGPKVADCICLMGLGHSGVVPVDTHVLAVTRRYYLQDLPVSKTVNAKLHQRIGLFYRSLLGEFAGWAQALLFNDSLVEKKKENGEKKTTKRGRSGKPKEEENL